jgi:hypothetical protein
MDSLALIKGIREHASCRVENLADAPTWRASAIKDDPLLSAIEASSLVLHAPTKEDGSRKAAHTFG